MKIKLGIAIVMAVMIAVGFGSVAYAFHDGGVAYCEGCHTMHNSLGNAKMTVNNIPQFTGNTYLLKGSDQSSTCLNCHQAAAGGYHISDTGTISSTSVPYQYTPGGDFTWLKISTTAKASYGASISNPGNKHGHNIQAADFNYTDVANLATSPGGTYAAANLACSSCHDPHGRYRINNAYTIVGPSTPGTQVPPIVGSGSYFTSDDPGTLTAGNGGVGEAVGVYRLLAGTGYLPDSYPGGPAFTTNAPFAMAPSNYNHAESDNGASQTLVAYGSGMSEWCANCHAQIHNDSYPANLIHPAGNAAIVPANIVANYNSYLYSGNMTGTATSAYMTLTPFERGETLSSTGWSALKALGPNGTLAGMGQAGEASDNVSCLSCHRAHASAWPQMTRFNKDSEFTTVAGAYPGTDAATAEGSAGQYSLGYSQAQYQAGMNGRPATLWATYQRVLCNKCHAKD